MVNEKSRAYEAGRLKARSIVEDVNLMYNDKTAARYYKGLDDGLRPEYKERRIKIKR